MNDCPNLPLLYGCLNGTSLNLLKFSKSSIISKDMHNIHSIEVHVDLRIALDEFLEILKTWYEFFLVLFGIVNLLAEPLVVDALIGWQPCSGSFHAVTVRNVVMVAVLLNHDG